MKQHFRFINYHIFQLPKSGFLEAALIFGINLFVEVPPHKRRLAPTQGRPSLRERPDFLIIIRQTAVSK